MNPDEEEFRQHIDALRRQFGMPWPAPTPSPFGPPQRVGGAPWNPFLNGDDFREDELRRLSKELQQCEAMLRAKEVEVKELRNRIRLLEEMNQDMINAAEATLMELDTTRHERDAAVSRLENWKNTL